VTRRAPGWHGLLVSPCHPAPLPLARRVGVAVGRGDVVAFLRVEPVVQADDSGGREGVACAEVDVVPGEKAGLVDVLSDLAEVLVVLRLHGSPVVGLSPATPVVRRTLS